MYPPSYSIMAILWQILLFCTISKDNGNTVTYWLWHCLDRVNTVYIAKRKRYCKLWYIDVSYVITMSFFLCSPLNAFLFFIICLGKIKTERKQKWKGFIPINMFCSLNKHFLNKFSISNLWKHLIKTPCSERSKFSCFDEVPNYFFVPLLL